MSARKRKTKRFVLDVNAYVSIILNGQLEWLLNYIAQNSLEIFVDVLLLEELESVLHYPKIKKFLTLNPSEYVSFVRDISVFVQSNSYNVNCPDSDDNYLYDIALSTNAKLIVTGDKALLSWKETPIETISLADFKNIF